MRPKINEKTSETEKGTRSGFLERGPTAIASSLAAQHQGVLAMADKSASATIHRRLNHPVIDADGHWIEFEPTLLDYLDRVAGPAMVDRFRREDYLAGLRSWARMAPEERRARRVTQPAWWGFPARNSLDRATAMLPRLL